MTLLKRPMARFDPAKSMLKNDHFQMAYVTSDMKRAQEVFAERFGITEWLGQEGETPSGGYIHVELGWCGGLMYELIETRGPGSQFYTEKLPAEGFAIRHHHLGFMIWNEADWSAFKAKVERENWEVMFDAEMEGYMNATYLHAPELDHYLEFILPFEGGRAFFESVPDN